MEKETGIFKKLKCHDFPISYLCFGSKSKIILFGCIDGTFGIYDYEKENVLFKDRIHKKEIKYLLVDPEEKYLLSSSIDGETILWDFPLNSRKYHIRMVKKSIVKAFFINGGRYLLTINFPDFIYLWDLENHKLVNKIRIKNEHIWNASIDPYNKFVVVLLFSGILKVFDIPSLKLTNELKAKKYMSILVNKDRNTLIFGKISGVLGLLDLDSSSTLRSIKILKNESAGILSISPDYKYLITGRRNILLLLDATSFKKIKTIRTTDEFIISPAFCKDSKYLAFGNSIYILLFDLNKLMENHKNIMILDIKNLNKSALEKKRHFLDLCQHIRIIHKINKSVEKLKKVDPEGFKNLNKLSSSYIIDNLIASYESMDKKDKKELKNTYLMILKIFFDNEKQETN